MITETHTLEPGQPFEFEVELPLGAGVGFWTPDSRGHRTLPPDWAHRTTTSLVQSAPVVVLHDAAGTALWGIACSEVVGQVQVRGGVSEEHKSVRLWFSVAPSQQARSLTIGRVDAPAPLADTVAELAAWLGQANQVASMARPATATEPVFSTWYTYTQDVNHDNVLAEGRLAAELGCGSLFIDDGWQVGGHGRGYAMCGEWTPDTAKFPDLRATVDDLRALGLETVIWVAPLLLGMDSPLVETMGRFAPEANERNRMWILDPRHPQVRQFVADTCARIVTDFGVAGLKIDFLNDAMVYADTPSTGDIDDVGEAMRQMLAQVRQGLTDASLPDPVIEFRQPYVSPAITAFGNCIRVGDCPADAVVNRQGSLDLRLFLAPADERQGAVVHADPLMWARDGGAVAVAQQFQSTFFSVPQVSMPLASLDTVQRSAVAHHLELWRAWRDVALFGRPQVQGSELGYTQASATLDRRSVVAVWRPELVDLGTLAADEVLVLNGSPRDGVQLVGGEQWRVTAVTDASGAARPVADPIPAYGSAVLARA
ncbi:glycoside hydrolase family 36 protein [Aestuariimicrobium soli]|uniref:glycoside hydrolase family 36 protein n=1 Tax=Aestuariimicrobium soli TaxID=2035834 RepID=UPI003EBC4FF6